ncbi:hypothetical protein KAR91_48305 [Candidatus Pacearchaeota archaeon]|nr:hypothetical protein [Candidatus Pacearchaeota archaeon]
MKEKAQNKKKPLIAVVLQRWVRWHVWHWPSKPENSYSPWYFILWKLIWWPVIYGGISLTYIGLLMTLGKNEADYWLRDAI